MKISIQHPWLAKLKWFLLTLIIMSLLATCQKSDDDDDSSESTLPPATAVSDDTTTPSVTDGTTDSPTAQVPSRPLTPGLPPESMENDKFFSAGLIENRDEFLDNGTVSFWEETFNGHYMFSYPDEDPYGYGMFVVSLGAPAGQPQFNGTVALFPDDGTEVHVYTLGGQVAADTGEFEFATIEDKGAFAGKNKYIVTGQLGTSGLLEGTYRTGDNTGKFSSIRFPSFESSHPHDGTYQLTLTDNFTEEQTGDSIEIQVNKSVAEGKLNFDGKTYKVDRAAVVGTYGEFLIPLLGTIGQDPLLLLRGKIDANNDYQLEGVYYILKLPVFTGTVTGKRYSTQINLELDLGSESQNNTSSSTETQGGNGTDNAASE